MARWNKRTMMQPMWYIYSVRDRDIVSIVFETAASSPICQRGWHRYWVGPDTDPTPKVSKTLQEAEASLRGE